MEQLLNYNKTKNTLYKKVFILSFTCPNRLYYCIGRLLFSNVLINLIMEFSLDIFFTFPIFHTIFKKLLITSCFVLSSPMYFSVFLFAFFHLVFSFVKTSHLHSRLLFLHNFQLILVLILHWLQNFYWIKFLNFVLYLLLYFHLILSAAQYRAILFPIKYH